MQKVYARTLGGRDFHLFEAMQLGLRLPLVFPFMDVVSLNVMGPRVMKTRAQLAQDPRGEDAVMEWDSRVDAFDKRLELWQKMQRARRGADIRLEQFENVSLFEFYWKFCMARGGFHLSLIHI